MKKFLSIIAAVGLTATASTAVVACGDKDKDKDEVKLYVENVIVSMSNKDVTWTEEEQTITSEKFDNFKFEVLTTNPTTEENNASKTGEAEVSLNEKNVLTINPTKAGEVELIIKATQKNVKTDEVEVGTLTFTVKEAFKLSELKLQIDKNLSKEEVTNKIAGDDHFKGLTLSTPKEEDKEAVQGDYKLSFEEVKKEENTDANDEAVKVVKSVTITAEDSSNKLVGEIKIEATDPVKTNDISKLTVEGMTTKNKVSELKDEAIKIIKANTNVTTIEAKDIQVKNGDTVLEDTATLPEGTVKISSVEDNKLKNEMSITVAKADDEKTNDISKLTVEGMTTKNKVSELKDEAIKIIKANTNVTTIEAKDIQVKNGDTVLEDTATLPEGTVKISSVEDNKLKNEMSITVAKADVIKKTFKTNVSFEKSNTIQENVEFEDNQIITMNYGQFTLNNTENNYIKLEGNTIEILKEKVESEEKPSDILIKLMGTKVGDTQTFEETTPTQIELGTFTISFVEDNK